MLLCVKYITNKDLLYGRGNYAQYYVITYQEKESEKYIYIKVCVCTHMYITNRCAIHLQLTWYCKSTILQLKKIGGSGERDFLGGPMVKTCASTAGGMGLIPGQGTKTLHAAQCGQREKSGKKKKVTKKNFYKSKKYKLEKQYNLFFSNWFFKIT